MKKIILFFFLVAFSVCSFAGNIQVRNSSGQQVGYRFTFNDGGYYVVEYSKTGVVVQESEVQGVVSYLQTPSSEGNYYFNAPNGGFFSGLEFDAYNDVTVNIYLNGELLESSETSLEFTYQIDSGDIILIEFI